MSDVKEKLIKSEVIRDYFLNKEHKKLGFFKYTKRKIGNFLRFFWKSEVRAYTIISNIISFGYLGIIIGVISLFGFQDINPSLILIPALTVPAALSLLYFIENKGDGVVSIPVVGTIISFLLYYFNSDFEGFKYAFYVFTAIMNAPVIITLCYFPFSVISFLWSSVFNRKSMINMEANLEIEDHEIISQVLKKEEFLYFLENYKKHSDMPLGEMKSYIKKMDAEKEALLKKQKSEELKILKKEKIKNYADFFYNKKG